MAHPRRLRVAFLSTFVRNVLKIILMSILIFFGKSGFKKELSSFLKRPVSSLRGASREGKKST